MLFGKKKCSTDNVQPKTKTRIMRFKDVDAANTWAESHGARINSAQVFQVAVSDADTGRKKTVVYTVYAVVETTE